MGLDARLDAERVTITGREGEALSLRTVAWGREGSLMPVVAREPALGACTSDRDASGGCIRRLEYVDSDLTEWWIGLGTGLKQGWTVAVAPSGEGPLLFDVAIGGALSVEGGGQEVEVVDAEGRAWTVGGVHAFGADGRPVPARVVATGARLRLEVDDAHAVYPLDIDPVYSTASWTVVGESEEEYLGESVAGAGDVNGDGYDDIIVGLPGYHEPGVGTIGRGYVYHGSSSSLDTTASTALERPGEDFCTSYLVSGAGDVNGDGYDDVVVGDYIDDSYTGRAYVYLGSSSGLDTTASVTLEGESHSGRFGLSVAGAGDVNGDGYDDVVVGSAGYGVYLYLGSSSGLEATASATVEGGGVEELFGRSVAGAGDVNGDGYDDVVVGAYTYNSYTGRVYVYHGSSSGLDVTSPTLLTGERAGHPFGFMAVGAGDVNRDGYDDLIVGEARPRSEGSTARQVYLYHGSSSGLETTVATTLTGESGDDGFGRALAGAGDVNGDGYDDIVVGAYKYNSLAGRASLYLGYADADGDGVAASNDCDDADATVHPGAVDAWYDGIDADCAGDEDFDADVDGHVARAHGGDDCADADATVHPGAVEFCNAVDDDCDGTIDPDSAADATIWYADADEDGYTDLSVSMASCGRPDGYALASQGDCDDADPTIHPGAAEVPADGIDQDCGGADDPDARGSGTKGHGCQNAGHGASIEVLALGLLLASRRRRASWGPARYVAAPVVRVPVGPRGGKRGRGPRGLHGPGPW